MDAQSYLQYQHFANKTVATCEFDEFPWFFDRKVLSLEGVGPGPLMGVKVARLEDVVYELSQTVKIDDIPIICHVLTQIYRMI